MATADELVDSIKALTDMVVTHAERTDSRIGALTNFVLEHAKGTDARIDALATEVHGLATEVRGLATEVRDQRIGLRDLTTETREGFRDLDRRIGRLENGTGPVASNR